MDVDRKTAEPLCSTHRANVVLNLLNRSTEFYQEGKRGLPRAIQQTRDLVAASHEMYVSADGNEASLGERVLKASLGPKEFDD
jgi:hypothetical protein